MGLIRPHIIHAGEKHSIGKSNVMTNVKSTIDPSRIQTRVTKTKSYA